MLRRSVALLPQLKAVAPCTRATRGIRTSASIEGGGGHYSEITDYDIHVWDRPNGFAWGVPEQDGVWQRNSQYIGQDYWAWAIMGIFLAKGYYDQAVKEEPLNLDEAIAIGEARVMDGVLVDLFPDQKDSRIFVEYRKFYPDHDPWTYDPTVPRPEYEGDDQAFPADNTWDWAALCREAELDLEN